MYRKHSTYQIHSVNEHQSGKTGLNACAKSVVQDLPVHSAQANQGRQFPPKLDFREKKTYLKQKISYKRKVSSLINLWSAEANLGRHLTHIIILLFIKTRSFNYLYFYLHIIRFRNCLIEVRL